MSTIDRSAYVEMYGPTVGDRVRLADTELWIEVEDLTVQSPQTVLIRTRLLGGAHALTRTIQRP